MISSEAKSFKAKSLGVEVGMEQNCNMAVQAGESSVLLSAVRETLRPSVVAETRRRRGNATIGCPGRLQESFLALSSDPTRCGTPVTMFKAP